MKELFSMINEVGCEYGKSNMNMFNETIVVTYVESNVSKEVCVNAKIILKIKIKIKERH